MLLYLIVTDVYKEELMFSFPISQSCALHALAEVDSQEVAQESKKCKQVSNSRLLDIQTCATEEGGLWPSESVSWGVTVTLRASPQQAALCHDFHTA